MTNPMNETWDAALEDIRRLSDVLKGFVSTLVDEGWTEEQARTLVVTTYEAQVRVKR